MVVEEFWPAVPEGSLILIAFENEFLAAAEAVAFSEVFGYTANEEVRPLPRSVKNPGEHGRRGGFPMGAADHDGMAPREEKFLQYLRKGAIRNPPVKRFFKLG